MTSASTGAPEVMAVLPPKRNGSVVPTPAAWQNCTATGSHSGPTQASLRPRSSSRRMTLVLSDAAPPPALSDESATTVGPSGAA